MRCDLGDDPAVIGIASATGLDEDTVVGKLHRLWSWANKQTADGNADGVTEKWIDRFLSVTGFAQAMVDVGWLTLRAGGITIPNFDRHNSQSAKVRALTAKRVSACKARKGNAATVTKPVPREEKRREENNTPPTPPKGEAVEIPPLLDTPAFRAAWEDWISYRRSARLKAYTPQGLTGQFNRLLAWGVERAIAAIRLSIAQGWQGIHEDKNAGRNGTTGHLNFSGQAEFLRRGKDTPNDS